MKSVNFDNVPVRHALFSLMNNSDNRFYVVSAEPIDTCARLERWPNADTESVEYYEEDSDGKFFMFYVCDCFDPPKAIIRANSWEKAYEVFCDEFTNWMKIDKSNLKDYDEENLNYSSSGVPIDTEAVSGHEVFLKSIEL